MGKSAPAPPPDIIAAIGNGHGCIGSVTAAPGFPLAIVDVLVIGSVDAARDVAALAVLARHAVSGAPLPPDAAPQPRQHRRAYCTRLLHEFTAQAYCFFQHRQRVTSCRQGMEGWTRTPFSTPMFTLRGPREDCWKYSHCCVFNPVKGRKEGGCCNGGERERAVWFSSTAQGREGRDGERA